MGSVQESIIFHNLDHSNWPISQTSKKQLWAEQWCVWMNKWMMNGWMSELVEPGLFDV